jgi:hypothetical protein
VSCLLQRAQHGTPHCAWCKFYHTSCSGLAASRPPAQHTCCLPLASKGKTFARSLVYTICPACTLQMVIDPNSEKEVATAKQVASSIIYQALQVTDCMDAPCRHARCMCQPLAVVHHHLESTPLHMHSLSRHASCADRSWYVSLRDTLLATPAHRLVAPAQASMALGTASCHIWRRSTGSCPWRSCTRSRRRLILRTS